MSNYWIILDVSFLCHRAFHTTGALSHRDVRTGVIYGFLRGIFALQEHFGSEQMVFAFDLGEPKRKAYFPGYKRRRHRTDRTPDEAAAWGELQAQMIGLRERYLPLIGYRNVLSQEGYEADDIIAEVVDKSMPRHHEAVVVSADSDLWQLINERVSCYDPSRRKLRNLAAFREEKEVDPWDWPEIKALMGDSSDEIPGIRGVGEKTAVKYHFGELKTTSKVTQAIESEEGRRIRRRNLKLIALPWPGITTPELRKDELSVAGWKQVCRELGLKSLMDQVPFRDRALPRLS